MTRIGIIVASLLMTCPYANADSDCLDKALHALTTAGNWTKTENEIIMRDFKFLLQIDTDLQSNHQNATKVTVGLDDLNRISIDYSTLLTIAEGAWQEHTSEVRDGCAKEDKIYDDGMAKIIIKYQTTIAIVQRVISYKQ